MQSGPGPRPFDVTTGFLIELDARAWLDWLGLPVTGAVSSIESDVATVLAEVDKVLHIGGSHPWLAHFELQASHDPKLPLRMLQYHALLLNRHELPVESTVILLRPLADGPELTGLLERHGVMGSRTVAFNYRVVRLWERPVEELLTGGLGLLPLAPLADTGAVQLPVLLRLLDARFRQEADAGTAEELRAATSMLLGLRYTGKQEIRELERHVSWIKESAVYQMAVEEGLERGLERGLAEGRERGREVGLQEGREEGRESEARRFLLRLGASRLGPAPAAVAAAIDEISDVEHLEVLGQRLFNATSWEDLLAPPSDN